MSLRYPARFINFSKDGSWVTSIDGHNLVVDDESDIREVVRYALSREGFHVVEVEDGLDGLRKCSRPNPAVVILDITMPRMNGIDFCLKLRQTSSTPIIFLSSKDDEQDRILWLIIGGDDYVSKPFSPKELVARVQAILRRCGQLAEQVAKVELIPMTQFFYTAYQDRCRDSHRPYQDHVVDSDQNRISDPQNDALQPGKSAWERRLYGPCGLRCGQWAVISAASGQNLSSMDSIPSKPSAGKASD